ncbi:hypothetical protein D3C71_1420420 [compost metagenome]
MHRILLSMPWRLHVVAALALIADENNSLPSSSRESTPDWLLDMPTVEIEFGAVMYSVTVINAMRFRSQFRASAFAKQFGQFRTSRSLHRQGYA